jgi:hypothetical protein
MSIPTASNGTSPPAGIEWLARKSLERLAPKRLERLAPGACARYPCGQADVAKLVDARDLKSLGPKGCAGSIPAVRTTVPVPGLPSVAGIVLAQKRFDIAATREYPQNCHCFFAQCEGDRGLPAIADQAQSGSQVVPARATFWKRLELQAIGVEPRDVPTRYVFARNRADMVENSLQVADGLLREADLGGLVFGCVADRFAACASIAAQASWADIVVLSGSAKTLS